MGVMNKVMSFLGLQEEVIEQEHHMDDDAVQQDVPAHASRKQKGNIVSIHSQQQTKVVLTEPRSYEETQEIADHLRSRRSTIVNLQRVRADQALRIVDFLSGTVYALNGNISKIGPNIFLCTPDNVEIQGAITELFRNDELEDMR